MHSYTLQTATPEHSCAYQCSVLQEGNSLKTTLTAKWSVFDHLLDQAMFCILVQKLEQEALKAELIIQNWKVGLDKDLKTNINVIPDCLERCKEDSLGGTRLFKSIPNETLCMALPLSCC